jgi:hypothetical protein
MARLFLAKASVLTIKLKREARHCFLLRWRLTMHIYELRACEDIRGINLFCDVLPFDSAVATPDPPPLPKSAMGRSHYADNPCFAVLHAM